MDKENGTFVPIKLQEDLHIYKIISIHYFEYMSNFSFPGESHNFWEFVCVDKGEVIIIGGETEHVVKKGEIIFHKPNEFHNVLANGKTAPNLVVLSFECNSPCMNFFENKVLSISETERSLIAQIIQEARRCFTSPLDNPYNNTIVRNPEKVFGSEQLIKLYLEQLLLLMIRYNTEKKPTIKPVKSSKLKNDNMLYERIIMYLEEHIQNHVSIDCICRDNLIGRSQLQKLFRERHQCGVVDYFSKMKINAAKVLIREENMNFTQISDHLGYTSIHYFSRQFKKITGMTPSEYASSIKVLAENPMERIDFIF